MRAVISVSVLVVVLAGAYSVWSYFGLPLFQCDNKVIKDLQSPDGEYSATVFERDCGATTSYVSVVSLRKGASDFDGDATDDFVFTMRGPVEIDIQWVSPGSLVVQRPENKDDIFIEQSNWEDVSISYVADLPG